MDNTNLIIIENLYKEGRFAEAYQDILKLLSQEPQNSDARSLYDKITHSIAKQNHDIVEKRLEEMADLIETGNYAEAITIGVKLKLYEPENKNLLKLIEEATKLYSRTQTQLKAAAKNNFDQQINDFHNKRAYLEAIKLIEAEYKKKPDPILLKKNLELRTEFVDFKLSNNAKAMEILPTEKVLDFLKDLSKFAPNHPELKKLQSKYNERLQKKNIANKAQYLEEAKRQIKVLFYQKKFTKAKQATLELSKIDPQNKFAKRYFSKCLKGMEIENHKLAKAKLTSYLASFQQLPPEQMGEYVRV